MRIKKLLHTHRIYRFLGDILLLFLTLAIIEVTLRVTGYKPWVRQDLVTKEFLITRDDYLGWRMFPGDYNLVPIDRPVNKSITVTIFNDGGRKTRANEVDASSESVEFIGGSFIQGHGLSDEKTIPWKVQQLLPTVDVRNYGVGAYGTIQTFLNMKLLLNKEQSNKRHIVYGFCEFHELRNVLDPSNLSAISKYSANGNIKVPYASLDSSGNLKIHEPEGYPMFYLRDVLSIVKLMEDCYMYVSSWPRRRDARRVTELLLIEMQKEAQKANVDFSVLMLDWSDKGRDHYLKFMKENGINAIDCVDRRYDSKDMRLENDPHPNEKMTEIWATCAANKLK